MKSRNQHPLLCVVEDWSGAGFRTKQLLNAGQPTVSQVVKAPNNQSCMTGGPPPPPPPRETPPTRWGQTQKGFTAGHTCPSWGLPPCEKTRTAGATATPAKVCVPAAGATPQEGALSAGVGGGGVPPQEWQTGKRVATFCCAGIGDRLTRVTSQNACAQDLRGSAPPKEFSFPPDAGSCGLWIGMTDGGVGPPPSKAV